MLGPLLLLCNPLLPLPYGSVGYLVSSLILKSTCCKPVALGFCQQSFSYLGGPCDGRKRVQHWGLNRL